MLKGFSSVPVDIWDAKEYLGAKALLGELKNFPVEGKNWVLNNFLTADHFCFVYKGFEEMKKFWVLKDLSG